MTRLRLRILFDGAMLGPGKAELLEHIRETGSIAAAGRRMDMSYKRAWSLVEEMNASFRDPLVTSTRGGPGGGGEAQGQRQDTQAEARHDARSQSDSHHSIEANVSIGSRLSSPIRGRGGGPAARKCGAAFLPRLAHYPAQCAPRHTTRPP